MPACFGMLFTQYSVLLGDSRWFMTVKQPTEPLEQIWAGIPYKLNTVLHGAEFYFS